MNDKVYDYTKWIVIIALPALARFIEPLFATWGIPYGPQIAETLHDLQIFLGAILGISAIQYVRNGKKKKEKASITEEPNESK